MWIQQVPTLIVKDKTVTKKPMTLTESMAICEYLEEAYPTKRKLLPKDAAKRFQVRRLCEIINAGTQPVQNMSVLVEVGKRFGAEHKQPWAVWAISRHQPLCPQEREKTAIVIFRSRSISLPRNEVGKAGTKGFAPSNGCVFWCVALATRLLVWLREFMEDLEGKFL